MNLKIVAILATVGLLAAGVSLAGAAVVAYNPVAEQLVEGHTVFAVIETVRSTTTVDNEFAAAVAVLVRRTLTTDSQSKFPGVLWFNDQYLTCRPSNVQVRNDTRRVFGPLGMESPTEGASVSHPTAGPIVNPALNGTRGSQGSGPDCNITNTPITKQLRYPCVGAVIATEAGNPAPIHGNLTVYNSTSYIESYRVTDPNDRAWDIDLWNISWNDGLTFNKYWTVGVLNNADPEKPWNWTGANSGSCDPYTDAPCGSRIYTKSPTTVNSCPSAFNVGGHGFTSGFKDPGDNGHFYPSNDTVNNANLKYNALLYFRLKDFTTFSGVKNHTRNSDDWRNDSSGCHPRQPWQSEADYAIFADQWPCPATGGTPDDDREGNSHPYNPGRNWPWTFYNSTAVRHGGSADCTGDAVPDTDCHATMRIDIHFGVYKKPTVRVYRVMDTTGSNAPYHCHDPTLCSSGAWREVNDPTYRP